jgi:hypothetical protein
MVNATPYWQFNLQLTLDSPLTELALNRLFPLVSLVTVITIIRVRFEGHTAVKISMLVLRVVMLSGSFKGPLSECSLYFSKNKEHLMGLSVSLFVISFMYPLQRPLPRNWANPRAYPRDEANRGGRRGVALQGFLPPGFVSVVLFYSRLFYP